MPRTGPVLPGVLVIRTVYSDRMDVLESFSKATRAWFESSFEAPTAAQVEGWPAISSGSHTLIHAPTGSGKTLAAFLWTLDRLLHDPLPVDRRRCRVLYVSPLKALAYDVDRNLRAPLIGIRHAADRLGIGDLPAITTQLRTGDTPAADRRRMHRHPPDVLITTPESLYLMLTSQVREILTTVRWVIVDEVHAVAGTKRGTHLALSLERLESLAEAPPQRIGLSATQRPLETIGQFLGGFDVEAESITARPVTLIDIEGDKELDIEIVVPVEDMTQPVESATDELPGRSIWPAVYPRLLDEIRSHQSTILFANSRRLAERISSEINDLAGEPISRAHHGSVAREQRVEIEEALKRGDLPCVVATSSLELGIDMGAVDHVIQVESPSTVASGLQRVGRAGHQVGAVSHATVYPKFRGDLLVSTVVVDRMMQRAVERTIIPKNPLDVLSQQIVAIAAMDSIEVDELYDLVRCAAPYAELGRGPFEATLDMLAGRYPSDLFAELRPRLNWDRTTNVIEGRPGAQRLAVQNPGTIPDRGLYSVNLPDGAKVGELDEEMVYESRPGDAFVLGTTTWRIADITPDRVEVVPAPGEPAAKMPFWHGDTVGRPLETGRALGAFVRHVGAMESTDALAALQTEYRLDLRAARNLKAFLDEEVEATGALPTDRTIVVQRFRDEIGDWRLVLLSPLGARVHAPWAMALTNRFRDRFGHDVSAIWADDGIAFRFADIDDPPSVDDLLIDPDDAEQLLMDQLPDTALFAARFREAAARALLLPRRRPGSRTPLWLQRRRSADLLTVAKQFGTFPMMLEVFREVLQDDFDLPALKEVLSAIRSRQIRVVDVELSSPSPFASSLLFSFVAAFMYEGDTPLAERRAAALTLDRDLLRELLGESELRSLIAEDVIAEVELELQHLAPGRKARSIDAVADLVRNLGPLTPDDIAARTDGPGPEWVGALIEAKRLMTVVTRGQTKLAAVEDAGRLRDGMGIQPPAGIPHAFLEPAVDPLGDIVGRYARTHGPFTDSEIAAALDLAPAVITTTLDRLSAAGRVVRGAFRPGGQDHEWVDTEVLRRLKRRSLAALRNEIEPVDGAAFARFELAWHGIDHASQRSSTSALLEVIGRLQAAAIPASVLERDVLSARMDFSPHLLDQVMVTGDVVWIGQGSIGTKDGRVMLFRRDQVPLLAFEPDSEPPQSPIHQAMRAHLSERGASFFPDLYQAAGGGDPAEVIDALWDLVWAGEITNDTLAPVRALLASRARRANRNPRNPSFPASGVGRWSLVADLEPGSASPTQRATAWTNLLLDRHGVVTRLGVASESVPGAFTGLYPVLAQLEDSGRVRRGYFVEGLGGAQFALPGAVDRLRSTPDSTDPVVLAATDPASPFGAALPWPETEIARFARAAGAFVILRDGELTIYVERGGRKLLSVSTPEAVAECAPALAELGRRSRKLVVESINDQPITESLLGAAMLDAGFVRTPKGLRWA